VDFWEAESFLGFPNVGSGILVMATLFGMFPFLKKLFADGGYQGPEFNQALARVLPHLKAEIVKRSPDRLRTINHENHSQGIDAA
jgi:hypothetical protein